VAGVVTVKYTEEDTRELIMDDLADKMPNLAVQEKNISALVKSKQNYKSEWEKAAFKAEVSVPRRRLGL